MQRVQTADKIQTTQTTASDQSLHCLLIEISIHDSLSKTNRQKTLTYSNDIDRHSHGKNS